MLVILCTWVCWGFSLATRGWSVFLNMACLILIQLLDFIHCRAEMVEQNIVVGTILCIQFNCLLDAISAKRSMAPASFISEERC